VSGGVLITRVAHLQSVYEPRPWTWAQDNEAAIAANWTRSVAAKPRMFNGDVLLISAAEFGENSCRTSFFESDFASFLAWRDFGYPDQSVANGYAMAALRGSDGAFVCGVMGAHTANAGRVYFPSGTPDRTDLRRDGTVDLSGSVHRELEEETGLKAGSYRAAEDWIVVRHWPALAFFRIITFEDPAEAVADRIRANISRQVDPELCDAKVFRGPDDIDPRAMPASVQRFLRWAFESQAG
jgi:8-oxo-dGTP pyrophosphatase MutT (NUDIX family)